MSIPNHKDAKSVSVRHVIQSDGTVEMEIVVTTDLHLHVLDPEHDKARVDALLAWAQSILNETPGANRAVVQQDHVS